MELVAFLARFFSAAYKGHEACIAGAETKNECSPSLRAFSYTECDLLLCASGPRLANYSRTRGWQPYMHSVIGDQCDLSVLKMQGHRRSLSLGIPDHSESSLSSMSSLKQPDRENRTSLLESAFLRSCFPSQSPTKSRTDTLLSTTTAAPLGSSRR